MSKNIIHVKSHNYFLGFDEATGSLHVQAGVLLSEILDVFVEKGWFLTVTPGTKLVTVGGVIASDVHGKNHHVLGCFSECVTQIALMLADGQTIQCSRAENADFFRATCGGMGLTGVILDATIVLSRIPSARIEQTTIKTRNLKETFDSFEKYRNQPYSVAWIDCLAKGDDLGRCLLNAGDFADDGSLDYRSRTPWTVPFNAPSFALNSLTVRSFNRLYYKMAREGVSHQTVDLDSFFYPLDSIRHWNRLYGKSGFTQYQFVLPKETSFDGLEEVLGTIAAEGKGSFLAVLKLFGKANDNFLSFPTEGYTLALDFKIEPGLFKLLDKLDLIVTRQGGRIYLAKDARVRREIFEKGYPGIEAFRSLRAEHKMNLKFNSLQSRRVGI